MGGDVFAAGLGRIGRSLPYVPRPKNGPNTLTSNRKLGTECALPAMTRGGTRPLPYRGIIPTWWETSATPPPNGQTAWRQSNLIANPKSFRRVIPNELQCEAGTALSICMGAIAFTPCGWGRSALHHWRWPL